MSARPAIPSGLVSSQASRTPSMPPTRRSARTASTSAYPYTRGTNATPSATLSHTPSGLKLTVKAPPSKLRKVTSAIPPNPYAEGSESDATPQPAARVARSTRNPKAVVEPDTDDVEDEDAEGEEDDDMDDAEDSDEDAEGEDDDMDELADPHPPPPVIKHTTTSKGKPQVQVTAPNEGPLKSVEAKEMEDDEDDEELSELEEDMDEDLARNRLVDAEDEGDLDSDDDDFSRSATPDLSKLTRRQRGLYEEVDDNGLMALSNEAQKKKQLTAEEQGMRRQEMARRRKNLSEKRNEEEKMDTINKLLNKPAPKRRTRAEILAQQQADALAGTPGGAEDGEEEKPDPVYTRYVVNAKSSRLGVPEEWLEGPFGQVLVAGERRTEGMGAGGGRGALWSGRMVEEVV
ncbi:INO80 complex subunit 2-like [Teratosphaeria destructans]|uniref:INO80 complex subunit 2-like n=1 Tax=Teratosphaeria destructans TaxID=418781 RepID=A0A9W7SZV0_9PEZI|nr:INO80 complex subunit 2-like [Teratosphaeria destructans]